MRGVLIAAAMIGLNACAGLGPGAPPPPALYADSGWRTAYGAPISGGEIAALRQSCAPRSAQAAIDSDRPVADPLRDNPAYHPGGEGLASAPPFGIAAPERPVEPGVRWAAAAGSTALDECLYEKGLVRAP